MAGMALFSLILMAVIGFLAGKILLLHRAADEIGSRLKERLTVDTNTLITLSSRDQHMRRLAELPSGGFGNEGENYQCFP